MYKSLVRIVRSPLTLSPDQGRVLLRPFVPGSHEKIARIIASILALSDDQVSRLLREVEEEFSARHHNLRGRFLERFDQVRKYFTHSETLPEPRRLLIGAYFLAEYSLESAALFNPSIVPDPDQSDLPEGALRFVLSLRATGEGHISSVTFRSGMVHPDGRIDVRPATGFLAEPCQIPNLRYDKALMLRKLDELGLGGGFCRVLSGRLSDSFSLEDLRAALTVVKAEHTNGLTKEEDQQCKALWMLARSNFEVQFQPQQKLSERVLFPATPSQRNGIEDARFVRFRNEDGTFIYYATFTAYDGRVIMPELVETEDFLRFKFISLNGPAAKNKGMALFPRKIDGLYAMLSRQDNQNIDLMFSDNVHFWNDRTLLLRPAFPWELVQIGNCGSPIETGAGWLVLSHGVGPLRKYCIGAFLLDLKNPRKIIGRLREPLIKPNQSEREGYVPNVVYTCGALLHNGELIVPYGLADHATGFATMRLSDVLAAME